MLQKKRNKATHSYLITLALQSRGDLLYVGPNTKNKKKMSCLSIYKQWDNEQGTPKVSPILNAHAFKKGKQAYSWLFGLWPFDQGGGTGHIFA